MLVYLMTVCLAVLIWFFLTRWKRPTIIREDADEYKDPNELRIVLIGKTGSGKSSTGNTILGKTKDNGGFKDSSGQNSCTKICERIRTVINKQKILVIDTPGLYDTARSPKEIEHEIVRCLFPCAPGPHALLFVVKANERFTEEEANAYKALIAMFGKDITKHIIVVITGGDILSQEGKTIEGEWDAADSAISMRRVVEEVSNRYIVFSNKGDNATKDKQVLDLLKMVTDMVTHENKPYFEDDKTRALWGEMESKFLCIMLSKSIARKKELALMKQQLQRKSDGEFRIEFALALRRITLQKSKDVEIERKYACRILLQKLQQEDSKKMEVEVLRIMLKKPELDVKKAFPELMLTLEQKENAQFASCLFLFSLERAAAGIVGRLAEGCSSFQTILHRLHQNEPLEVTEAEMQWIQEEVEIIEKEAWAELQQDIDNLTKKVMHALVSAGCVGCVCATGGVALVPASGAVLFGAAVGEAGRRVCLIM